MKVYSNPYLVMQINRQNQVKEKTTKVVEKPKPKIEAIKFIDFTRKQYENNRRTIYC